MESYTATASQKPPKAHIPQWFQTVQSLIIFLKACGWRGGKNHEVPEQMTHCRQNDKAVSERTGHLAKAARGSDVCPFTHSSFIHSPLIHACWALWQALWRAPGEAQQNKRLSSPGPPLYQGEWKWVEKGVWGGGSCGGRLFRWREGENQ